MKLHTCTATIWLYPGMQGAWHFVTIPSSLSDTLRAQYKDNHKGWSSLPLVVTIGATAWNTSMFYDKRRKGYILPIKAAVRKKEDLFDGDTITLSFQVLL